MTWVWVRAFSKSRRDPACWCGVALAFFLVLTWVLRGTPLVRRSAMNPRARGLPLPRARTAVIMAVSGLLLVATMCVCGGRGRRALVGGSVCRWLRVDGRVKTTDRFAHASPTLRRVVNVFDTAMTLA